MQPPAPSSPRQNTPAQASLGYRSHPLLQRSTPLSQEPVWIRQGILLGKPFHYRHKNPWVHNSLNLLALALVWLGFLGVVYSGLTLPVWLFLPLGSLGFGLGYFALLILTVHEASHNMFFVFKDLRKTKIWNRRLGLLLCFPFGIDYINHWEIGHQIHHLYPVEAIDPQNCPNTIYTSKSLGWHCLKALLIPGYVLIYRRHDDCIAVGNYARHWQLFARMVVCWSVILVSLTTFFPWQIPLAVVLGTGWLSVFNQFKIAMEHSGEIGQRDNPWLRSVSSFFPLRNLLMPFNISLHFEHHLNDAVPWYDLPKYHEVLKTIIPPEIQGDVFHFNWQVWQTCQQDSCSKARGNPTR